MITDLQRGIVSGLMQETFIPDEINMRFEICEKLLPKYKDLFTEQQLQILRLIYQDAKRYNQDGTVVFGLSEKTIEIISKKYPYLAEEIIEIQSRGPITEKMIPVYLKELEKQNLMMEL